jgi:Asp-tRNA(Asn)/Glu-tRNA(Gln) amidotransferase B subunit
MTMTDTPAASGSADLERVVDEIIAANPDKVQLGAGAGRPETKP